MSIENPGESHKQEIDKISSSTTSEQNNTGSEGNFLSKMIRSLTRNDRIQSHVEVQKPSSLPINSSERLPQIESIQPPIEYMGRDRTDTKIGGTPIIAISKESDTIEIAMGRPESFNPFTQDSNHSSDLNEDISLSQKTDWAKKVGRIAAAGAVVTGMGIQASESIAYADNTQPQPGFIQENPFPSVEQHTGVIFDSSATEQANNQTETRSFKEEVFNASPEIKRTWERTDKPVLDGVVSRTWMWGNDPRTPILEEAYKEAPNGKRQVVYFDKSRMEITHPDGDKNSPWFITNGLLAQELITGKRQIGDNTFEDAKPAEINVAGDPGSDGVTYATFNNPDILNGVEQNTGDNLVTQVLHPDGSVTEDASLEQYNIIYEDWRPETRHNIASPFWRFMNSTGPVYENGEIIDDAIFETFSYATGLPITEAYWTEVEVGGVTKKVLVQAFERRVLTFTPDNPDGWQVEAGNVGQHYYKWLTGENFPNPDNGSEQEPKDCPVEIRDIMPKEIKTEKELLTVINDGCVGIIEGDDPNLTFAQFEEALSALHPGEKFQLIIKDSPEDVPSADPNVIRYNQTISYNRLFPGKPDGKMYYEFNEETQTNTVVISLPTDIDYTTITEEEKIEISALPAQKIAFYADYKGDVSKPVQPESVDIVKRFAAPGSKDQVFDIVYSPQQN